MKTLHIILSIMLALLVHTCSAKLVNAEVTVSNHTEYECHRRTPLRLRKNGSRLKSTEE